MLPFKASRRQNLTLLTKSSVRTKRPHSTLQPSVSNVLPAQYARSHRWETVQRRAEVLHDQDSPHGPNCRPRSSRQGHDASYGFQALSCVHFSPPNPCHDQVLSNQLLKESIRLRGAQNSAESGFVQRPPAHLWCQQQNHPAFSITTPHFYL